jgi:hypothetical protein
LGFASTPRKSWYPRPLWHLEQAVGTTAGLSSFQCANGSEVRSACAEASHAFRIAVALPGVLSIASKVYFVFPRGNLGSMRRSIFSPLPPATASVKVPVEVIGIFLTDVGFAAPRSTGPCGPSSEARVGVALLFFDFFTFALSFVPAGRPSSNSKSPVAGVSRPLSPYCFGYFADVSSL